MDALYQAIKNLFQALLNLLVSVIELIGGLIGALAMLLVKMKPSITEIKKEKIQMQKPVGRGISLEVSKLDEQMVIEIQEELQEKIKTREQYLFVKASLEAYDKAISRKIFVNKKRRLHHAIMKVVLEEMQIEAETVASQKTEEISATVEAADTEKSKIQSICEVTKEAIG